MMMPSFFLTAGLDFWVFIFKLVASAENGLLHFTRDTQTHILRYILKIFIGFIIKYEGNKENKSEWNKSNKKKKYVFTVGEFK